MCVCVCVWDGALTLPLVVPLLLSFHLIPLSQLWLVVEICPPLPKYPLPPPPPRPALLQGEEEGAVARQIHG